MSPNVKSKLVFDFPDPEPCFDFSDANFHSTNSRNQNPTRVKLTRPKGIGNSKSNRVVLGNNGDGNNSKAWPLTEVVNDKEKADMSNATITTASASSTDDSALDNFDDEIFKLSKEDDNFNCNSSSFPNSRNENFKSESFMSTAYSGCTSKLDNESIDSPGPHYEFATEVKSNKMNSKNILTTGGTSHRLKSSVIHGISRTSSNFSSEYVSDASEFSFDRVTVNTFETGRDTTNSSNVSWNFFEEPLDSPHYSGESGNEMFIPYTGVDSSPAVLRDGRRDTLGVSAENNIADSQEVSKKKGFNSRILIQETLVGDKQRKVSLDRITVSENNRENCIPIMGIISDSNQSIISEISGDNADEQDENVLSSLKLAGSLSAKEETVIFPNKRQTHKVSKMISSANETSCKQQTRNSKSTSFLDDIQLSFLEYRRKKCHPYLQSSQRAEWSNSNASTTNTSLDENRNKSNKTTKEKEHGFGKSAQLYHLLYNHLCIPVEFCAWYMCGVDTTLQEEPKRGKKWTKGERQKEMDETILGKTIFCNVMSCHNLNVENYNRISCQNFTAML